MEEPEEVAGGLLVPGGDPPVLLDPTPEPLDQVPVLVPLGVDPPPDLPVPLGRDHGPGPRGLDRPHDGRRVVPLVRDHHRGRRPRDERRPLGHVRRLSGCQDELGGQPEPAHPDVDLGPEPAPAPAQRLLAPAPGPVRFFFAPAAHGWARMMAESRISHSRSGSWRAANTAAHVPFRDHRSNRFQTAPHFPNRSGRSRHGIPVLATYRTASRNSRLSRATHPGWPGRPGSRCSIRSKSASEIACRNPMAGPPWRAATYQDYPALVYTA